MPYPASEQISFTLATLHDLLTKPQDLPKLGRFPVLQARYTDGKLTAGYFVIEMTYVPGGALLRFQRMSDDSIFAGFYRFDTHRNGAMFTSIN